MHRTIYTIDMTFWTATATPHETRSSVYYSSSQNRGVKLVQGVPKYCLRCRLAFGDDTDLYLRSSA
jgi:hypothetical protein